MIRQLVAIGAIRVFIEMIRVN